MLGLSCRLKQFWQVAVLLCLQPTGELFLYVCRPGMLLGFRGPNSHIVIYDHACVCFGLGLHSQTVPYLTAVAVPQAAYTHVPVPMRVPIFCTNLLACQCLHVVT